MTPDQTTFLFERLIALGAVVVHAEYSGSGDSGQFDGLFAYDAEGNVVDQFDFDKPFGENEALKKVTNRLTDEKHRAFSAVLEQAAWDAVDEANHSGFWNDEGGYGKLIIDVAARTIVLEHSNYITTQEDHVHQIFPEEDEDNNTPELANPDSALYQER